MIARIKTLTKNDVSLAGDLIGIAGLFVMLFVVLALPGSL